MNPQLHIEQAIYGSHDVGGYRFLARSPGFSDAWLDDAQALCTAFGDRPAGVRCPLAVFARPFGSRAVAVVQVADQGADDSGRPGALAFRLLVVPRDLYLGLGGDPFLIADTFPPPFEARGALPILEWTGGPPPARTVAEVRKVLDVFADRTALLLGSAQILVDGGRVVLVRKAPDPDLIRDLWMLLPTHTRAEIWPATFAFGNKHGFHLLAVPEASGPAFAGYTPEEQAGDYPEGHYEYALQKAAEDGDQAALDQLLARRSSAQMFRLVALLLVFFAVMSLIIRWGGPKPGPKEEPAPAQRQERVQPLKLPPVAEVPELKGPEREDLARRFRALADGLGVKLPEGSSERSLRQTVGALDRQIDEKLGPRRPTRDPGKLDALGPVQQQLRAVLWKHGVEDYAAPGLNVNEMLDRLQDRLTRAGLLKEDARD